MRRIGLIGHIGHMFLRLCRLVVFGKIAGEENNLFYENGNNMRRFVYWCLCLVVMFGAVDLAAAGEGLRILFLGNSFTNYGPIPDMVADLAADAGFAKPEVLNVAENGQSLEYHRNCEKTLAAIDAGGWGFVVLQEYSTRPTDNIGDPAGFKRDATWLYDRIKASSPQAKVVLYETWARNEFNDMYQEKFDNRMQMQNQLNKHYHDCVENYIPANSTAAVKDDLLLARVGEAWDINYWGRNMMLHDTDKYHAGNAGRYLNSLVIYSTIYGKKTSGLKPQLELSEEDAEYLQGIADRL